MSTEPYLPNRQSTRWKGFDYAGGATYFVTICVLGRRPIFGRVENDEMHLSPVGQIVGHVMVESVAMRAEIELVAHVVMPNHLHVLVTIIPPMIGIPAIAATPLDVGAHGRAPAPGSALHRAPRSLGSFVGGFKAAAAKAVNDLKGTPGQTFWQRGYRDRVIRNDREFGIVAEYIAMNPARWGMDQENPERSA